jgi:putative ABC transport system permease protein
MLGLLGGLLGTVVGIDVTSAISIAQRWLVVLDPRLIGLGVLMGVLTGALAGLYPAWTATRFAPAETLRGQ